MAKARDFKFCTLLRHVMFKHWTYKLSLEWAWSWSCDVFKFKQISDNTCNSKTVQDDRRVVSIKVEQEVTCALSNGYVADDQV